MKRLTILLTLFLSCIFFLSQLQAQRTSVGIMGGASFPILDNGFGVHVGIHPSYRLNSYLSLEGQASFTTNFIDAGFLSGQTSRDQFIQLLAGPRIYLSPRDSKNRYYFNLLLGWGARVSALRLLDDYNNYFGYSGGFYAQFSHWILGVGYETPQNIFFKIGYQL